MSFLRTGTIHSEMFFPCVRCVCSWYYAEFTTTGGSVALSPGPLPLSTSCSSLFLPMPAGETCAYSVLFPLFRGGPRRARKLSQRPLCSLEQMCSFRPGPTLARTDLALQREAQPTLLENVTQCHPVLEHQRTTAVVFIAENTICSRPPTSSCDCHFESLPILRFWPWTVRKVGMPGTV